MKKVLAFLKITFLVLIALILTSFALYHIIPSPAKTTRSFFMHLKYERYEKAYQLIDGIYKESRGSLERFSSEYYNAVLSGTRTRKVTVRSILRTDKPKQYIVNVTVQVLYRGEVTDTDGSYLLENIRGKGWRIVRNVSSLMNKK